MNNLGDPEMITALFDLKGQLPEAVKKMRQYGIDMAKASSNYRAAKATRIRELKAQGLPATLILDLAQGDCSKQQYERDMTEVIYDTQKEYINSIKTEIRVLEGQIEREWGAVK